MQNVLGRCLFTGLILFVSIVGFTPGRANAATSLPYLLLSRPERGRVLAAAWSPDGHYIAVGTDQGLWIYTESLGDVFHLTDVPIHAVAWSPDGANLALGYFGQFTIMSFYENLFEGGIDNRPSVVPVTGGGLSLWSVQKTGQTFTLAERFSLLTAGSVYALRFSPDSRRLASLSQDRYGNGEDEYGIDTLHIFATDTGILVNNSPNAYSNIV